MKYGISRLRNENARLSLELEKARKVIEINDNPYSKSQFKTMKYLREPPKALFFL